MSTSVKTAFCFLTATDPREHVHSNDFGCRNKADTSVFYEPLNSHGALTLNVHIVFCHPQLQHMDVFGEYGCIHFLLAHIGAFLCGVFLFSPCLRMSGWSSFIVSPVMNWRLKACNKLASCPVCNPPCNPPHCQLG